MAVVGESVHVPSRADALLHRLAAPGTLLAGRYRPLDVLGQGGMGLVARALDTRLGREVAIKWLLPELVRDPAIVARFAAEATALARIHHPNVVQILDVSAPGDGEIYYVMELVPGESLVRRLRERGPLPWALAFDVLMQTGSALAAVHAAGLVHRDVKPSNILCTELGPESIHVEVIDFGIARVLGAPRLTLPGEMIGTLPYMAPEQFAGLEGDPRTDVYGWGVLALELLGRISPAKLFGVEALAGAPLRDAAPRVLEEARVQPRIAAIVRSCLATQAEDRWTDMREVVERLHALDDGGAPTLIYRRDRPERSGATLVPGIGTEATLAAGARLSEEIGATDEQLTIALAATGEQSPAPLEALTQVQRGATSISARRPSALRWIAPAVAVGIVGGVLWWNRPIETRDEAPARDVDTAPQPEEAATPAATAPLPAARPTRAPDVVTPPPVTELETIDAAVRAEEKPPRSRPRPREATSTTIETPASPTPAEALPDDPTPTSDVEPRTKPQPKPGKKPRRRDLKDPFG